MVRTFEQFPKVNDIYQDVIEQFLQITNKKYTGYEKEFEISYKIFDKMYDAGFMDDIDITFKQAYNTLERYLKKNMPEVYKKYK